MSASTRFAASPSRTTMFGPRLQRPQQPPRWILASAPLSLTSFVSSLSIAAEPRARHSELRQIETRKRATSASLTPFDSARFAGLAQGDRYRERFHSPSALPQDALF